MKIKKIAISELKSAEYNPRKVLKDTDKEYQAIKYSIDNYGYCTPIVWNEVTGNIVSGHQRFNILKQNGETEIEVSIVNMDCTKEKELNLALNKISGIWDTAKLELLVCELKSPVMKLIGFEDIINKRNKTEEDDFDIDNELVKTTEPMTKLGDIWKLGNHRIACGDSCDSDIILKLMDGEVADLVVTDPPYNVDIESAQGMREGCGYGSERFRTGDLVSIANDKMSDSNFAEFLNKAYSVMNDCLRKGGGLYIFYSGCESVNFITEAKKYFKFYETLIWVKNHLVIGRNDYHYKHEPILYLYKEGGKKYFTADRTQTTVILENKPLKNNLHPTKKPLKLLEKLIHNSSREKEIVLDIFGGSGSTLIACEQLDRVCYMCELEPKYVAIIIERWEKLTNMKAVKLCQS